uniref:Integral membrane bound transporter domain-containing protein n=1 Tax=Fagus sylvatica TaxID=28930 RepID=A0A2N9FCG2_FAGSY
MFNKEEAYWAGLTIAIGFNPKRQATFTASNARAQGTAMGSVYGILCSSIFRRSVDLMCLPLFPWIIFTSFLSHSRMYSSAGALSAVVGALLILGRKNYGSPIDFAISRTTEAFIGLICFIFVEILFHPIRSATLAKFELSHTLGTLRNCINAIVLCVSQTSMTTTSISPPTLGEQQKKLKSQVSELEKLIVHAKLEPNFWLLPFHAACYDKLLESLLKMVDILFFVTNTIESISQILQKSATSVDCEELLKRMNGDLQVFKEKYGSSLKCLQEVTMTKSSEVHEKKLQNNNTSQDIERGRSSTSEVHGDLCIADREGFLNSFLENSRQVVEKITNEGENLKSQMVLCSSVLAFCISSLMMETLEMKKKVKELVKWENSSSHTII